MMVGACPDVRGRSKKDSDVFDLVFDVVRAREPKLTAGAIVENETHEILDTVEPEGDFILRRYAQGHRMRTKYSL